MKSKRELKRIEKLQSRLIWDQHIQHEKLHPYQEVTNITPDPLKKIKPTKARLLLKFHNQAAEYLNDFIYRFPVNAPLDAKNIKFSDGDFKYLYGMLLDAYRQGVRDGRKK